MPTGLPTIHPVRLSGHGFEDRIHKKQSDVAPGVREIFEFHLVTDNLSLVDLYLSSIDFKENNNV
jgi:hypothetical protein